MSIPPAPPSSPSAAARLRQLAQALRAQRRLAASGRPGYDLDAHRDLLRAFRKARGLSCDAAPRQEARARARRTTRESLRAQAEALFARKP